MSQLGAHIDFSEAWRGFLDAVGELWNRERSHGNRPHLTNYSTLAEEALALVRDVGLGAALQESYLRETADPRRGAPARLYVLELTSFAGAVKGLGGGGNGSVRDLLGDASTLADSAKDIFTDLPGWVKAGIHGFGEVAKLFKPR